MATSLAFLILSVELIATSPIFCQPAKVGSYWAYAHGSHELIYTVTKIEYNNNGNTVYFSLSGKDGVYKNWWRLHITPTEILEVAGQGGAYIYPPRCIYQIPAKGANWKSISTVVKGEVLSECSVKRGPKITVPAGRFETIVVNCKNTREQQDPVTYTRWYTPGIGIVQMDIRGEKWVLKEYKH